MVHGRGSMTSKDLESFACICFCDMGRSLKGVLEPWRSPASWKPFESRNKGFIAEIP